MRTKSRVARPAPPTPVGEDLPPARDRRSPPPEATAAILDEPDDRQSRDAVLRRTVAELQASKARLERESQRERDRLQAQLVHDLLPVLDNLNRSLDASHDSPDQALRQGVQMVRDQFEQVLRGFGVVLIEARGVPFDPAEHEALAMVPADDPNDDRTVMDVVRPGYRHNGKLLRAAQVTVGQYSAERRGPPNEDSLEPMATTASSSATNKPLAD